MATSGLLTEVLITERGSNAAATAEAGAAEVEVADVTDFTDYTAEDTTDPVTLDVSGIGIVIDILGERYTVATVTPGATDAEVVTGAGEDYDLAAEATPGTLTLTEPLRVTVDEDDPVWIVLGTEVATDAYALVSFPQTAEVLGEETDAGDIAQVPIPYGMRASYPEGVYDPPVPIVVADDLTTVLDTPGVRPVIDGSSIVNPPLPDAPTEPPETSPAVEVHGTVDSLVVEVTEPYAGSTTLDFHVSTEANFEPTAATLVGSSRSAVFVITGLPETGLDTEADDEANRLRPDVTYYVRTVARNDIGSAPPGPVASGMLDPSTVSEIIAARLVAGFILAGSVQAGNITIDPATGITIPQSDGGVIHFPADGSPATITAYLNARALRVENDLSINGVGELAGTLTMTGGAPPPRTPPTVTYGYPRIDIGPWQDASGNPELPSGSGFVAWSAGFEQYRIGAVGQMLDGGHEALMVHDADTGEFKRMIRLDQFTGAPFANPNVLSIALAGFRTAQQTYVMPKIPEQPDTTYGPYYAWVVAEVRPPGHPTGTPRPIHLILIDFGPADETTPPTFVRSIDITATLGDDVAIYGTNLPQVAMYWSREGAPLGGGDWHPAVFWETDGNAIKTALFDGLDPAIPQIGATQEIVAPSANTDRSIVGASWTGYKQVQLQLPSSGRPRMAQFATTAVRDASGNLTGITYSRESYADVPYPEGAGSDSTSWARGLAVDENDDRVYVLYPKSGRIYRLRADGNAARMNYHPEEYWFTAAYTWYDGNPVGGIHESTPSPQAAVQLPPMTWPIVTCPAPPHAGITDPLRPDLANRIGIYAMSGFYEEFDPVMLQMYLPVGRRAALAGEIHPGYLDEVSPPPTVDGFELTTEEPGNIRSGASDATGPLIYLDESGEARLGNLRLDHGAVNIGRIQTWLNSNPNPVGNGAHVVHNGGFATLASNHPSNDGWTGIIYSSYGVWTCQQAGIYDIEFGYNWQANTAGRRMLFLYKNATNPGTGNAYRRFTAYPPSISGTFLQVAAARMFLAVGDTIQLGMYQSGSTGSVTLNAVTQEGPVYDGTNYSQYLEITRVG